MKIWLLRASEFMPIVDGNDRLLRMGLLAEKLTNMGHDVTWFASTFNHFKKKQYSNKDVIVTVKDNYRLNLIHAISYKKNISIKRIINHQMLGHKLKRKMHELEKPDLIFASFPTIEFAHAAVKYGKKNNIPVIIDVRDLWPDIFNHNLKGIINLMSKPYVKYLDIKTKKIMKECDYITSISPDMLKWALKKGGRKKTKLDDYFYIGYKKDDKKIKKSNIKLDKKKFNICFCATINNQFNYDLLANIAGKLENKDVEFLICGDGPNIDILKEKINGLKNVRLLGWLNKYDLNYVLDNSDLGFAPYKNTFDFQMSVSNKFSEYLSHGLPILMTVTGYMKSLINKYDLGFSSENVDDICDFVINLQKNEKKCQNMSKNAIILFEEYFDADKIYDELSRHLENLGRKLKK